MPRPQRCRRVCREPDYVSFLPEGGEEGDAVSLSVDEFEVLRLVEAKRETEKSLMDCTSATAIGGVKEKDSVSANGKTL